MRKIRNLVCVLLSISSFFICLSGCGSSSGGSGVNAINQSVSMDSSSVDGFSEMSIGSIESGDSYDSIIPEEPIDPIVDSSTSTSEEKMTYSATLILETTNLETSMSDLDKLIEEMGGIVAYSYVENEDDITWNTSEYNTSFSNQSSTTIIELKIPQENYQKFISSLRDNDSDSIFVYRLEERQENLTSYYKDYELSLESLRIQEERLKEFMSSAVNVTDMLDISDRLTTVQYEIEKIVNSMNAIDNRVAYSDINITLNEVVKYTDKSRNSENFLTRLSGYFSGSFDSFLANMEDILELIIYLAPHLIVLAIVIYLVVKVIRKVRIKKQLKRSENSNMSMNVGIKKESSNENNLKENKKD